MLNAALRTLTADDGEQRNCRVEHDFNAATEVFLHLSSPDEQAAGPYTLAIVPPEAPNLEGEDQAPYRGVPEIEPGSTLIAGAHHYCAIAPNGQVRCFGESSYGQAGSGDDFVVEPTGIDMSASIGLSVRGNMGCALRSSDQNVLCWGQVGGQLDMNGRVGPQRHEIVGRRVFTVNEGFCVQKQNGQVWCRGSNQWTGNFGLGETRGFDLRHIEAFGDPAQIQGAQWGALELWEEQLSLCRNYIDANANGQIDTDEIGLCHNHTCLVSQSGSVRCTGANRWGQIGTAEPQTVTELTDVEIPGSVDQVAVGGYHTCALQKGSGRVFCWGYNGFGQVGQEPDQRAENHKISTPTEVPGLVNIQEIAAGAHHTCALRDDQQVLCWGRNGEEQLGLAGDHDHRPLVVERLLVGHAPVFSREPSTQFTVGQQYEYEPRLVDADADIITAEAECSVAGWPVNDLVWENDLLRLMPISDADITCTMIARDSTGRITFKQWQIVSDGA